MNRIFYLLATLSFGLQFSCSSNSKTAGNDSMFSSVPDTVRPTSKSYDYFDADGVFVEGGAADYLIKKPYNDAGFVFVSEDVRWHIKVSEKYQEQMHKYPSLESFKADANNARNLYLAVDSCEASRTNIIKLCDCSRLIIK
ncbi:hypothetical protein [Dyadobacter luticola]|uniref:Uncharacterized protein n=1 Tax=Dyadobacter luticola TaxID=1979387 RepID=A0A5R9KTF1_9BACT|nr:hypothetical protein [Dyadobacter luticola]TLU99572.1 hypothetical protein FEN17_23755 [Dyadobacter luticola]